jgi:predicted PurR-regulated permease PerM
MRTSTVRTQSLSPQSSGTTQIARFTYPARRNWGTVAFLLNYVPILGPLIGVTILVFAGLLSIETLWLAFVTAGVYVLIHVVEGETITPMLLAKRFTINPVLVILALVFWYWMWGILGAILAVPMVAVTKIVCDRIEPLAAFGHFIEG